MHYKSKKAKATNISKEVKAKIYERDGGLCIICGKPGIPNAHYIRRWKGGLGIEENGVTLCPLCHHEFDNGEKREEYKEKIRDYLKGIYPNWSEEKLIYKKWEWSI